MRNNGVIMLAWIIILISLMLCGCQNNEPEDNKYDNIFESEVSTLVNYSIDLDENKSGVITMATINGIIKNSIERKISINITAKIYDKKDNLLGEAWYLINNMPIDYQTTFTITYEKENVADLEYFKLEAIEIF